MGALHEGGTRGVPMTVGSVCPKPGERCVSGLSGGSVGGSVPVTAGSERYNGRPRIGNPLNAAAAPAPLPSVPRPGRTSPTSSPRSVSPGKRLTSAVPSYLAIGAMGGVAVPIPAPLGRIGAEGRKRVDQRAAVFRPRPGPLIGEVGRGVRDELAVDGRAVRTELAVEGRARRGRVFGGSMMADERERYYTSV